MKIHPALLVNNLSELLLQISNLTSVTKDFDIDIIDWQRSAGKTLTVSDALDVKGELNLHFDLMLDNPADSVKQLLLDSRVKTIILSLDCLDEISILIDTIHHHGKRAGLSLNPNRRLFEIAPYINDVELIQIFTIEPGSQGQPFLPERLLLCQELKLIGFKGEIEIDGGVNMTTIESLKEFPIDILSIGSALSKAADPADTYNQLLGKLKS